MAVFGERERFGISLDGGVQEDFFRIEAAQLEVIHSQFGAQTETHIFQIGGAGLRSCARGFDFAANAAPEIGLVGNIEGNHEIVGGGAAARADVRLVP